MIRRLTLILAAAAALLGTTATPAAHAAASRALAAAHSVCKPTATGHLSADGERFMLTLGHDGNPCNDRVRAEAQTAGGWATPGKTVTTHAGHSTAHASVVLTAWGEGWSHMKADGHWSGFEFIRYGPAPHKTVLTSYQVPAALASAVPDHRKEHFGHIQVGHCYVGMGVAVFGDGGGVTGWMNRDGCHIRVRPAARCKVQDPYNGSISYQWAHGTYMRYVFRKVGRHARHRNHSKAFCPDNWVTVEQYGMAVRVLRHGRYRKIFRQIGTFGGPEEAQLTSYALQDSYTSQGIFHGIPYYARCPVNCTHWDIHGCILIAGGPEGITSWTMREYRNGCHIRNRALSWGIAEHKPPHRQTRCVAGPWRINTYRHTGGPNKPTTHRVTSRTWCGIQRLIVNGYTQVRYRAVSGRYKGRWIVRRKRAWGVGAPPVRGNARLASYQATTTVRQLKIRAGKCTLTVTDRVRRNLSAEPWSFSYIVKRNPCLLWSHARAYALSIIPPFPIGWRVGGSVKKDGRRSLVTCVTNPNESSNNCYLSSYGIVVRGRYHKVGATS